MLPVWAATAPLSDWLRQQARGPASPSRWKPVVDPDWSRGKNGTFGGFRWLPALVTLS